MRVLFHLPYPGYLRLYGSTIAELADRGNEVLISYDAEKQRSPAAEAVESRAGVSLVDPLPRRSGPDVDLVSRIRLGADYLRYLAPEFAGGDWLRERMERYLPDDIAFLRDAPGLDRPQADTLLSYLRALEASIPPDPAMNAALERIAPDCIFVSPVLARGRSGVHQRDSVKSAKALAIPVGVGVASWDHLTSKGVIGEIPNALYVWNNAQKAEALKLHGVPRECIVVTGAQPFDHWFEMRPALSREQYLGGLGLDPSRRCLLYVGSSPNITPVEREREAVRSWLGSLRDCRWPELREASVLIRPHPGNVAGWSDADLSDLDAAISPRERPDIVMSDAEEHEYFHALYHSSAVVGINTSAMIEASIVGRAVHTMPTDEFSETREGTLHYHLLTKEHGGCLRVAPNLDVHFAQIDQAVRGNPAISADIESFVTSFVRPGGLDRPATRMLAKAIERLPR